jgi:hypothetical protein
MWRVQHQQLQAGGLGAQQAGRATVKIVVGVNRFRGFQFGKNGGIAWDQGGRVDALGFQRKRQRAGDVGQAAGFDQRENLRGDGQDLDVKGPDDRSWAG